MILQPGVHPNIAEDLYYGLCTPEPALSSSGARLILEPGCPAAFWWQSHMNPNRPADNKREFDLGTAAHLLTLEPSRWETRVVQIDAEDYRTKDARAARDAAYTEGKIPLRVQDHDAVKAMNDAFFDYPEAIKLLSGGAAESTYVWQAGAVWLKARPDYVKPGKMADFKTTTNAGRRAFERAIFQHGYHQQAAWNLDAHKAITGEAINEFYFIVQEVTPPHLVAVYRLDEAALEWGRLANRKAVQVFAECLRTGKWPGYQDGIETIGLPGYAEFQLEEAREFGKFSTAKATSADFHKPLDWDDAP